jgi:hypothetical protein
MNVYSVCGRYRLWEYNKEPDTRINNTIFIASNIDSLIVLVRKNYRDILIEKITMVYENVEFE